MTPERKIKEKIKAVLKKHNVYYFTPRGTKAERSGLLDFAGFHKGRFFAIEAKAGGKMPTSLQCAEIDRIIQEKGTVFLIRGDDGALQGLDNYLSYDEHRKVSPPMPAMPDIED